MPARKKRDLKWYLLVVVPLASLFLGGGFLAGWLGERGARGVRIRVLEKQVEELKERLEQAEPGETPPRSDSPETEGTSFRARMLAQAQHLELQIEVIDLPGLSALSLQEKQGMVRCLVFHLAVWELFEECERRGALLQTDQIYCQDPETKELLEIPAEVKRLASFCAV